MASAGRRERAVWGLEEERVLLALFLEARADPAQRSERGVRGVGWQQMANELNARCHRQFDKDQVKSKYVRIMQEFELFRSVSDFLGPIRNASEEKAWEKLVAERPKNAQQLRQFRETGFAHADDCQRIVDDLGAPEPAVTAVKRPRVEEHAGDDAAAAAKKSRPIGDGRRERAVWGIAEEKLLLFLYLRAKQSPELRSDKGIKSRGWQNVVDGLNKHSGKEFDKDQCKSKYQRIMQEFELFKSVTGYPATKDLTDQEWEALFEERPRFAPQLRVLKDRGFAHAETCALITGEISGLENQPSNVSEFIASESLQLPSTAGSTPTPSVASTPMSSHTSSSGALTSVTLPAPLALAANVLPFLLPASGNISQSVPQSNRRVAAAAESVSNGAREGLAAASVAAAAVAAAASPFFSQELHDNLNLFLKTATAYMTMEMSKRK